MCKTEFHPVLLSPTVCCVTDSPVLFRWRRQLPIQLRLPRPLARVLDAPVPVDGRRDFIQPGLVGNVASEGLARKFLHAITLRMAERFEQARPHEQRNVMRSKQTASISSRS